jgi:hypothetical protein
LEENESQLSYTEARSPGGDLHSFV